MRSLSARQGLPLLTLIFIGAVPLISVAQNSSDGPAEAEAAPIVIDMASPLEPESAPPPPQARKKLSYKDQRDYDLLPARIEEIETEMAHIESDLSDGTLFTRDHKRFTALTDKLEALRGEKTAAEDRWLELAEAVEALG